MKINVTQTPLMGAKIGNRFLRVGEFVPAAALTARQLSQTDLEHPSRLQGLYTARRAMTRTLGDALPLETELKAGLTHRLCTLNRDIAWYEHTPEFDLPIVDPSFLSWKTQAGFPAFSIFSLDKDTMKMSFRIGRATIDVFPAIPDVMAKHYLDDALFQSLQLICNDRNLQGVELTAKYGGVMPETVREHIHQWLSVPVGQPRFELMLIVAEAPEESWKVVDIPRQDPLVISVAHGLLWLVDAYDLTPMEDFVRQVYAQSRVKTACN